MIAALAVYGVVGAALIATGARLGRRAFLVAAIAPAVSFVWTLTRLDRVLDGRPVTEHVTWVSGLDLAIDLRLDGLAATMTLVIAGVGVLVLLYAAWYFADGDAGLGALSGLLVLFAGAMVGVVQSDHLLVLYGFWEITSIASYLLIGHDHEDAHARGAALHALLVTALGGLAMLGGFVLLGHAAGTYRLSELVAADAPDGAVVTAAVVLVLLGAFTKSAQYPFHAWLPGAMAAPTPVSAYLHSATMVKAGVYLVARLAPLFAVAHWLWRPSVLAVGLVTLVAGGLRALRQRDLKLLLAHSTVSQLGFMMLLFGAGLLPTSTAGWTLLVAHALFKAALFMVVGIVDHQTGTRDIRRLPPLTAGWGVVNAVALVGSLSMAGVPLVLGFVAKEGAYTALDDATFANASLVLVVTVLGSMVTAAYSARFYLGAFVWPRRRAAIATAAVSAPRPALAFVAPAVVLSVATLGWGVAPGLLDRLASASVGTDVHLALWHGWNVPLVLSALTLAGGAVLVAFDHRVQGVVARGRVIPSGERVYVGSLRALGVVSRRVTGVVQSGSLPVYAGVILATVAVLPGVVLATRLDWPGWPDVVDTIASVPIALLLVVVALATSSLRRRFSAAIVLGAAGYGMAGLFVVHGAPDLALTQAAIETLSTVLFVLVLRRLPDRFERQSSSRRRVLRLGIAALVGATVFVFALAAAGNRPDDPVSGEMVERALPDGEGRNVVNVVLVDFRGLDTLGEITVLAVASIGAVALARVGRRGAGQPDPAGEREAVTRVVFVDVSAQVVFYAVLMGSLWLLFAGHNQPGGGFVGGLLAGAAIALRYVAGGMREVRALSRFKPWTVLGTGLVVAAVTATFPLLTGDAVLDASSVSLDLPLAGAVKLSSALAFDIGVYLTVVGMVLMVFEAFGDEPQVQVRA